MPDLHRYPIIAFPDQLSERYRLFSIRKCDNFLIFTCCINPQLTLQKTAVENSLKKKMDLTFFLNPRFKGYSWELDKGYSTLGGSLEINAEVNLRDMKLKCCH